MLEPPLPPDEKERLAALRKLGLLDTPAEDRFDRITRIAKRMFGTPVAYLALVDAERQWFKSIQGLDAVETTRGVSFCGHAILKEEPTLIPDARKDARFSDNPLVTGPPHIRFYAGQPLKGPSGHRIGTLCVVDRAPRMLAPSEIQVLGDLARIAEDEIRMGQLSEAQQSLLDENAVLRRESLMDPLTRGWNRRAIERILDMEWARTRRDRSSLGLLMADVDHFKKVNDTHGHPAGDQVLREVAARIRSTLRSSDAAGRFGGEEFLVVLPGCDELAAKEAGERLRARLASEPFRAGEADLVVTGSVGVAASGGSGDPQGLVHAADDALLRAKRNGRNRVEG
ncbi:MAG: sensor domain-containing diguanylate cyclase [Planctomycetota bacterium]